MSATTFPAKDAEPIAQELPRDRGATRIAALLGFIAIIGAAAGAAFWPGSSSESREYLTHSIKRWALTVSVTEQGTLESSNNTEIKCKVRGFSTVT